MSLEYVLHPSLCCGNPDPALPVSYLPHFLSIVHPSVLRPIQLYHHEVVHPEETDDSPHPRLSS